MPTNRTNKTETSDLQPPPKFTEAQLEHFRSHAQRDRSLQHLYSCVYQMQYNLDKADETIDGDAKDGMRHRIDEMLMQIAAIGCPDEESLHLKLDFFSEIRSPTFSGNRNLVAMLGIGLEMDIRRLKPKNPRYKLHWAVH